jgi:hypothetical protein
MAYNERMPGRHDVDNRDVAPWPAVTRGGPQPELLHAAVDRECDVVRHAAQVEVRSSRTTGISVPASPRRADLMVVLSIVAWPNIGTLL